MHTFATTTPITADIDIPAGRVQLIAAHRTDTTVEIRPTDPTKNRDVKAAARTTADFTAGVLRVTTTTANQLLGPSGSVEITVQLPTGSHLKATAASADLRAVGTLGTTTFNGSHATIKIDETAAATLHTDAGDVTIGRLTGPADITTTKGDIHITEATNGTVTLTTQAGNLTVNAAPGISATLDAGTSHGRVTNTLKNDGTANLNIHATTAYGDIVARSL